MIKLWEGDPGWIGATEWRVGRSHQHQKHLGERRQRGRFCKKGHSKMESADEDAIWALRREKEKGSVVRGGGAI